MLTLHTIKSAKGARKDEKRIGRGLSSKGTYSGRGVKGQRARSGGRSGLQLKGLRNILLAIPKSRGFSRGLKTPDSVNVDVLSETFADGAIVTPEILKQKGLIKSVKGVKILGRGELNKKLTVKGCRVTSGARTQIEKAGGQVIA